MDLIHLRKLAFAFILASSTVTINNKASAQLLLNPATQPRFVNELKAPSVIDARNGFSQPLEMEIVQFPKDLGLIDPATGHPFVTKTTVWGYQQKGSSTDPEYPGPTIVAKRGVPLDVFWYNKLIDENGQPLPHLLPVDRSIHTAFSHTPVPVGVPIVTHLHGGHTESASDGLPDAWFTPNFTHKGHGFVKGDVQPYHYANDQEAATIWYHDHALGITRLNVYAGLAGFYLLTDNVEQNLKSNNKLPAAPYDLGLAIQDRLFTSTGQLYYPAMPEVAGAPDPSVLPEMFGNVILVNGKAWPVLDVEPRQYRFRILNGSDSRFYNLFFSENIKFWQIGSDLGLLPAPVGSDQLLIANGERKDVMIDFSNPALWGKTIIMRNNAKAPYPKGSTPNPQNEGQIMAFKVVKPLNTTDRIPNTNTNPNIIAYNTYPLTPVPATLRPALVTPSPVANTRKLILFEGTDNFGRLKAQLGTFSGGAFDYTDAITENPAMNSTEIWEIYNQTVDAHPIHLHLVHFQVLSTQKFKPKYASAADEAIGKLSGVQLLGQPQQPEMGQRGLKDTYPIQPGEVARFIATFDRQGLYVWHCHILSHEDHDMMRPYYVGDMNGMQNGHKTASAGIAPNVKLTAENSYQLFPNPFTTVTNLHFKATEAGNVTVKVYDLKGRLVKEVFNGSVAAGEHQQQIDASAMSNGLYVCEIQLNGKIHRERLVVAK